MTTFNDDPDLLKKVITVDESWAYGYDIETKTQSSRFATIEEIKKRIKREAVGDTKKVRFRCVSRIGENSCLSVVYLKGVTLKETR